MFKIFEIEDLQVSPRAPQGLELTKSFSRFVGKTSDPI